MNIKPVLCIHLDAETSLRLLEERHVAKYAALIERNKEHLRQWSDVEAYQGPVEALSA